MMFTRYLNVVSMFVFNIGTLKWHICVSDFYIVELREDEEPQTAYPLSIIWACHGTTSVLADWMLNST